MRKHHVGDRFAEVVQTVPGPHLECGQMRSQNGEFRRRKLRQEPVLVVSPYAGLVGMALMIDVGIVQFPDLVYCWHSPSPRWPADNRRPTLPTSAELPHRFPTARRKFAGVFAGARAFRRRAHRPIRLLRFVIKEAP